MTLEPMNPSNESERHQSLVDYERIARAIQYIDEHRREQPSLGRVAGAVGLSEYHFQRLFRRWAGVSPKRFLQFLTAEYAQRLLRNASPVLATAYEVGLSGPGRLHDLMVSAQAVTPGQAGSRGAGVTLRYGLHPSPFGWCFVAISERGICELHFFDESRLDTAVGELTKRWRAAVVRHDPERTEQVVRRIFAGPPGEGEPLPLFLRGTNWQLKVWQGLLAIPDGHAVSYGQLAARLGRPTAARAVASAVSRNPVAMLIPCHRVLRGVGGIGGYRWGAERKRAILAWEASRWSPLGRPTEVLSSLA